ncbi:Fur family transcriptional regulator [Caulobacter sp. Root1455]|nr:Fur family transcriptional regulator [Caulobacter sp. Root487D2Y]KQY95857.1 Fur family transcriptional regulator [Caulobacter sp. Root1455]
MAMAHHAACDHDHHNHGVAGSALAAELAAAEARCGAAEQRLTAPRRRVLELLLQAGQPVKAYDLIASFAIDGPPAKPPTVYRALDFLEKQGFAHRIESLNAYVACRKEADGHAAAFLICDCCGATREIEPKASAEIIAAGASAGYTLTGVTIEAHGLCADCRDA